MMDRFAYGYDIEVTLIGDGGSTDLGYGAGSAVAHNELGATRRTGKVRKLQFGEKSARPSEPGRGGVRQQHHGRQFGVGHAAAVAGGPAQRRESSGGHREPTAAPRRRSA